VSKKLRLSISVILLAWLASRTDWDQVGDCFRQLRPVWWLGALGLFVLTQLISAYRWQLVARPLGFARSLRQFTGFYFIGMFFNLFLPTSVGGDVVRAWYLDGGTGRRLSAFLSAFVDRASGLLLLLGLACLATALCPIHLEPWVRYSVWGSAGCALFGMALLPLAARCTGRFARVRRLTADARLFLHFPGLLLVCGGLSLVIQAANVVVVWLVGQGLGVDIPLTYYWIFVPMVTLLTLLPISLNGMGVREGGMVLFLGPLGVVEGTALSFSFLWFAVFTAASLLGGGIYLFGHFPPPPAQGDHEPVGCDSDQGRAREFKAAA
jgi:uncharacterized membrane protein YbhN (UPF0104 family)